MDASQHVRPATVGDAARLARCHLACWQEAYRGIVPHDVLEALTADVGAREQRWAEILRGQPSSTWVAPAGDEIVGLSSAGRSRDEDLADLLELYALYVRGRQYGTGLAQRLMEPAIGAAPAYLWVAETNLRAERFYAKVGFVRDGREKRDDRFGGIREIRMVRS